MSGEIGPETDESVVYQMERLCGGMFDDGEEHEALRSFRKPGSFSAKRAFLIRAERAAKKLELLAYLAGQSRQNKFPLRPELVERLSQVFEYADANIIDNPFFEDAGTEIRDWLIYSNTKLAEAICFYRLANSEELCNLFENGQPYAPHQNRPEFH